MTLRTWKQVRLVNGLWLFAWQQRDYDQERITSEDMQGLEDSRLLFWLGWGEQEERREIPDWLSCIELIIGQCGILTDQLEVTHNLEMEGREEGYEIGLRDYKLCQQHNVPRPSNAYSPQRSTSVMIASRPPMLDPINNYKSPYSLIYRRSILDSNRFIIFLLMLPLTPNEAVITNFLNRFPLSRETLTNALQTGKKLQIPMQGSQAQSQQLQKILLDNDFYQKAESKLAKQQAFEFLRVMIEEWSTNIAKTEKRISREEMHNYVARVLVFGSYVLELNSNDSDVDVICVVPNFINRQKHFFQDLASKFEEHPAVKNLSKITTASVPIISFEFKDLPIDISFSQLNLEIVPKDIEKNLPTELINSILDEKCKLSILGRKNNVMIKESAPNQEHFKSTLRLIKVWAKNRGISSNQIGFLGGISWAILVAKICQLFPLHYPNKLLAEFFNILSIWDWRNAPVKIVEMEAEKTNSIMTVYTPGVVFNSTTRINEITLRVIQKELKRARQLVQMGDIKKIFDKVDFFNDHPFFIEIDVCGTNQQPHHQREYNEFLGTVQSKFIQLLSKLCSNNKSDIESQKVKIVPFPRVFRKTDEKFAFQNAHFFGISIMNDAKVDFGKAVQLWSIQIFQILKKRKNLNVFVFECQKNELTDVDIEEHKKKKEDVKEDPRRHLFNKMVQKTTDTDFFKKQYMR